MEFKLNKIDMELRQAVNDETSEGKIHSKKEITINKDSYLDKRQEKRNFKNKGEKKKFNLEKYISKDKKIVIEAVKTENLQVEATKEEKSASQDTYMGRFIDIRR